MQKLIRHEQEQYGWEFLFLGANIDAAAEAARFGIGADRAADYHCDSEGTALNYEVLGDAIRQVRSGARLSAAWKADIDADYHRRGRK